MTCWQVDGNPLTAYLSADGRPVPGDGSSAPWLASPPCWTFDGQPVAPVAVLRRKLFDNGDRDYVQDPRAETRRSGSGGRSQLRPDPMHLVHRHATYLEARLPQGSKHAKRAVVLEVLDRAVSLAQFVMKRDSARAGEHLVVDGAGLADVFRPGPMPGVLVMRRCTDRTSKSSSCLDRCPNVGCRPPYAEIESVQPAASAAEVLSWARHLRREVGRLSDLLLASSAPGATVDEASEAAARWVEDNIPVRRVAEPGVVLERIRKFSPQPGGVRVWTDAPAPFFVPLPAEHRHAPHTFLRLRPFLEFHDGIPYRFSTGAG